MHESEFIIHPFPYSLFSLQLLTMFLIGPTQSEARGQRSPLFENITPATQDEFEDITINCFMTSALFYFPGFSDHIIL